MSCKFLLHNLYSENRRIQLLSVFKLLLNHPYFENKQTDSKYK